VGARIAGIGLEGTCVAVMGVEGPNVLGGRGVGDRVVGVWVVVTCVEGAGVSGGGYLGGPASLELER
jgi:hypothetical protein